MKPATVQRQVIPELMDQPDARPEELIEDLRDLMRLNRFGWGRGLMGECVRSVLGKELSQREWTLLDVATGSADIPRYLVDWSRRKGVSLRVTATDLHPVMLRFAREQCRDYPEITIESADLLSLPYAGDSFDIVTCSQALHHFHSQEIVTALQRMARIARRAVIVSDLVRSKWGEAFVWLAIRLGRGSRFARHDGPASMRNGFKLREIDQLACEAGLNQAAHIRHRGLRFSMTWLKGGS